MPKIRIDMIFDPSCPWCYIGKRQLREALDLRPHTPADVRWWPFLLHTDVPAGGVDRYSYLCRKYGSEGRLKRMQAAITEVGAAVRIKFAFDRIRRTPNTLNAHRLIRFAEARGRGEPMLETVFRAYFVGGRDIGDTATLVGLGAEVGFDPNMLRAFLASSGDREGVLIANERAHRLGINGVPTFVFDRRLIICGAQEPATLARMIDAARHLRLVAGRLPGAPEVPQMSSPADDIFD
jgi:predicted DsbA family dithiol-disulfide isomerase